MSAVPHLTFVEIARHESLGSILARLVLFAEANGADAIVCADLVLAVAMAVIGSMLGTSSTLRAPALLRFEADVEEATLELIVAEEGQPTDRGLWMRFALQAGGSGST